MNYKEGYEKICQTVLRKHYREYRKRVDDSFFIDSEQSAERALTEMLNRVREEVNGMVYIDYKDLNSRNAANYILSEYLLMGRRYATRYYKNKLGK